jgi:hypothetical protein
MPFVVLPIPPGSVSVRLPGRWGFTCNVSPLEDGRVIFLSNLSPGRPPGPRVWWAALAEYGHLFPLAEVVRWERRKGEDINDIETREIKLPRRR